MKKISKRLTVVIAVLLTAALSLCAGKTVYLFVPALGIMVVTLLIDGEEVCRQLNISKRTLHTYRERGVLPFSSIEGKTLFRQKDIEGFLQSRTVESE